MKIWGHSLKKVELIQASIPAVGIILATILINTTYPNFVLSQTTKNLPHIMKNMDANHKFTIGFKSILIQTKPPRWDMGVYVNATPNVLKNIQKVNYLVYPNFTGPNGVLNKTITS